MTTAIDIGGEDAGALPIWLVPAEEVPAFGRERGERAARWLEVALPQPSPGDWRFLPGDDGDGASGDGPGGVIAVVSERERAAEALAPLAQGLPAGRYRLAGAWDERGAADAAWHWRAGSYRYRRGGGGDRERPVLVLPEGARAAEPDARALDLVRDLVNTPAEDLGPAELAGEAEKLANEHGAEIRIVRGDELAEAYPMVAAVGRAAEKPPALADLRWGDPDHPKVTLAGKGVCFDSGGLDIKPADGMRNMKKDMGGAAHALALAHAVMARRLPVRLRVVVPAVENAIAGGAYRPGDVLRSRKGLTVEIHNTDAEGRLVLADALADAASEEPDLLLDFATLTGAARVALGPEVPALFSDDDALAEGLQGACGRAGEALWRLPLHRPYRSMLDSHVADMTNASAGRHAGAITAALFLEAFVGGAGAWAHFDLYAWNDSAGPGRPAGGEGQCLRGVAAYLAERYGAA